MFQRVDKNDITLSGIQNVGYKSHVLAPWVVPGKSGQIRGLVAPAEAGYK